jgi:hypothetical protein
MLERPGLLLLPWTTPRDDAALARLLPADERAADAHIRPIAAPDDGSVLGCALHLGPTAFWASLFRGCHLRVFESDDASLVLSARRPPGLWRPWQVFDAEENPVGACQAATLFSPLGPAFARRQGDEYRTLEGELLTICKTTPRGCQVRFAETPAAHPFARMVILAALLGSPRR